MFDQLYPRLSWQGGDILLPPWSGGNGPRVMPGWALDEREGTILPFQTNADWGVAWRPARPVWATPHGVWESAVDVAAAPAFCAFCPEPDVLWGESDLDHRPTLEGSHPPRMESEFIQSIETADLAVRLFFREERGRCRFAVVRCRDQADDGAATWQRYADESPAIALHRALLPYDAFARRQATTQEEDFRRLEACVARMIRELRTGIDPRRLFRVGLEDASPVARNWEIGELVRAWNEVRPDIARALLRTLIDAQAMDGALPSKFDANGIPSIEPLVRPVCARAFRLTWNTYTERVWFDEMAPRIQRHVESLVHLLDPDQEGLPRWPNEEESLIPRLFDREIVSADLLALLAREITELEDLASAVAVRTLDLGTLPAYRDKLLARLRDFLWVEETKSFSDRYADGRPVIRRTFSALVPLVCRELTREESQSLLSLLVNREHLLSPTGLLSWAEWAGDTTEAPVDPTHQLLMLDALIERKASAEYGALRAALLSELPDMRTPAAQALLIALLAIPSDDRLSTRILSPALIWLNQRRRGIFVGLAALFLLFNLTVVLYSCRKTTLTPQTVETTVGLARRLYREARYDEAEKLLSVILASASPHPSAWIEMGNVQYRLGRWAEAEQWYRKQKGPPVLQGQALHNLAVLLLEQNREAEAREIWRQLASEYAVSAPAIAARAQLALKYLPPTDEAKKEGAARQGGRGEMPQ